MKLGCPGSPFNRRFVGRREELAELHRLLNISRTGTIVAIHGLGGTGKTEVAFSYAHAFAARYPGWRYPRQRRQRRKPPIPGNTAGNGIDRVEPFFVCILGQRYGWTPEPEQLKAREDRQRQQVEKHSITDMEVRHAVLNSRLKRRSYFYLRATTRLRPPADTSIRRRCCASWSN